MKTGEFLSELKKFDENLPVIMSKDAEGNRYYFFGELVPGYYQPETTWNGEFYSEESLKEWGVSKDDVQKGYVIYPGGAHEEENPTKIADIVKELHSNDSESEMILSKDEEGNDYSPLYGVYEVYYREDDYWGGEIYDEEELAQTDYDKEKMLKCVVLFPVN